MKKFWLVSILILLSTATRLLAQGCHSDLLLKKGSIGGMAALVPTSGSVRICAEGATAVPCNTIGINLFSDSAMTKPINNPVPTDANGNYTWCTTNGTYTQQPSGSGIVTKSFGSVTVPTSQASLDAASHNYIGNNTHSGIETFSCLQSSVNDARCYPGADPSIKINACIATAIVAGGGTCDARGFAGNQTMTQAIAVGNASLVPVVLILPNYGSWTWRSNLGVGLCAMMQYGKSAILGTNAGEGAALVLIGDTGFSADSVFCTKPQGTGPVDYFRTIGFTARINTGATATVAVMDINGAADLSVFDNLYVVAGGGTSPIGMNVRSSCCGTTFRNIGAEGNSLASGITNISSFSGNISIQVLGYSFVHPTTGTPALLVTGGSSTGNATFSDGYYEPNPGDLTTSAWQVDTGVIGLQNFVGGRCNMGTNASRTSYCIDVATGSQITATGVSSFGIPDLNAINDHASAQSILGESANGGVSFYSTKTSQPQTVYPNALRTTLPNGTTVPNVAGKNFFLTNNASATTITGFTGQQIGQIIFIQCGDVNTTIQQNSVTTLQSGVDFICSFSGHDTLVLYWDNVFWREIARTGPLATNGGITLTGSAGGASSVKKMITEPITLSTVGTTTDSVTNLLPANSIIYNVSCRTITAITGATNFSLGDASNATRFSVAQTNLALGFTIVGMNQWTVVGNQIQGATAGKLRITTTGTPTAGQLRCETVYEQFAPPTS